MARHRGAWLSGMDGILAAALIIVTVVAAMPAAGQERDRGEHARAPEHGRGSEERRPERHRPIVHERRVAPVYGYDAPTYVPDPPPMIYAPPTPSGGLSLFFNFR